MKSKTEVKFEIAELRRELSIVKKEIYQASCRKEFDRYEKLIYRQEDLITRIDTLEWVLK